MVAGDDFTPKASQLAARVMAALCVSTITRSGANSCIASTTSELSMHWKLTSGSLSSIEQINLRLTASGSATSTRTGVFGVRSSSEDSLDEFGNNEIIPFNPRPS